MRNETFPGSDAVCCAYVRRSRQDIEAEKAGHFKTLEKHEKLIRYTADDNGHSVAKWFRELGSGETIADRDAVQDMLREVAKLRWDVVYVVEESRLGRGSGSDQDTIVNAFRYTGTWLVTELKVYNPHSKADMKMLRKELQNANDELGTTNDRLMRGRIQAVKEGCWINGDAPYGWKKERIKRKWQLVPHEVNHARMIEMTDMAEAGASCWAIKKHLDDMRWPSPSGKGEWSQRSVRNVVTSLANVGYVYFGVRKTTAVMDPETFSVSKEIRRNPDFLLCKGLHWGNGTISEEKYERIVANVCKGIPYDQDAPLKSALAGLIKCSTCKKAMIRHSLAGGKYVRFEHNFKSSCRMKSAPESLVMDVLVETLKKTAADMELSITDKGRVAEAERTEREIKALESELSKAKAAKSKAFRAYEADMYTDEEFRERKAEANARIDDVSARLEDARSRMPDAEEIKERVSSLHDAIDVLNDSHATAQEKNDVLRRIVKRIEYSNFAPKGTHGNDVRLDIFLR